MSEIPAAAEEPRKLFDLSDSEGVNESERILTHLCQQSFLRLWSQTNIYTDEGFKDGKGGTKELSDALVIFGNDVLIFSDKDIKFQTDREMNIAWPRWYKRAVLESCKQLHGAKSWLSRFPERAFLDAKCTRKLPIVVPTGVDVRFHLVAVTRGSRDAALAHNEGDGLGTFGVNSALEGADHLEMPFVMGLPEPTKSFVHVFDEVSIDLVMKEFDTAVDFIDYLKAREALLAPRGCRVIAPGEEELVAAYLRTMDRTGTRHVFFEAPEGGSPDLIVFDGHYEELSKDPGYLRKKEADQISYAWDKLIDRFLAYGDPGLHERFGDQTVGEIEQGLRLLAAESRFSRRRLATSYVGALERVDAGMRLGRQVGGQAPGETVFVFLVMPRRGERTYEEFRQYRLAVLHAYVQTARLKAEHSNTFVGIAFDNPHNDFRGGSEDLFVFIKEAWTPEELAELEQKRKELNLWKEDRIELWRFRQDEFPQASQAMPMVRLAKEDARARSGQEVAARKSGAEKRRQKMQKASKRRNRKKK